MSYGCAYCRAIEPVLQHVAAIVQSKQKIFRVNIAAYWIGEEQTA